ncbi:hypothetical protein HY041_03010, partial [Candidatus Roizmanbacteria bacterium]|nr:hypothetical protein [Candidatus Roizmanbacteria bacterium]
QGLWWASTAKPAIWFVSALKKGDVETSLTGSPIAEILNIRYYPWYSSGQYDLYLTLKLKVSGNPKTGKYNFKRSTIGVGSPIDLEFPSVQISGTVIQLDTNPFEEKTVTKTVILTKKGAFPWEYSAINIGDKYFDGEQNVFEVLDKKSTDIAVQSPDVYGNSTDSTLDPKKYIVVKAKIKLQEKNNQLIFGEEQVINPGKTINISTANFTFNDYVVGGIE